MCSNFMNTEPTTSAKEIIELSPSVGYTVTGDKYQSFCLAGCSAMCRWFATLLIPSTAVEDSLCEPRQAVYLSAFCFSNTERFSVLLQAPRSWKGGRWGLKLMEPTATPESWVFFLHPRVYRLFQLTDSW